MNVNGTVTQFSTQSNIFGKIALIQQIRPLNLGEVFCYPLGLVPWSLATNNGELIKTSKSALMNQLEKLTAYVDNVQMHFAAMMR